MRHDELCQFQDCWVDLKTMEFNWISQTQPTVLLNLSTFYFWVQYCTVWLIISASLCWYCNFRSNFVSSQRVMVFFLTRVFSSLTFLAWMSRRQKRWRWESSFPSPLWESALAYPGPFTAKLARVNTTKKFPRESPTSAGKFGSLRK